MRALFQYRIKNGILVLASLFIISGLKAQKRDTTNIFSFKAYMDTVINNHPVAYQADLLKEKGEARKMKAKGKLDPKALADLNQKYFDDKKYFSNIHAGFSIPTWLGIDFKAGYDQGIGQFVNPESLTPQAGLIYAGVEVPIGQGLFFDQRRAAIQKAKIFQNSTVPRQTLILNELLQKSAKAYWDWFKAYNKYKVYENAVTIAQDVYNNILQEAQIGERPYIDTLEAGIRVRNRSVSLQEAKLEYKNATAQLSVYLWIDGNVPIELDGQLHPKNIDSANTNVYDGPPTEELDKLISNHPEVQVFNYKLQNLNVQERWNREQLKPQLSLRYNPITTATREGFDKRLSINNFKWGFSFSMPLFLREERGNLKLTRLVIRKNKLSLLSKKQSLKAKLIQAINNWKTTIQQSRQYQETVNNYQKLFKSEIELLQNGESELFKVNSRQLGLINSQIKYIKFVTQNYKATIQVYYSLGQLPNYIKQL